MSHFKLNAKQHLLVGLTFSAMTPQAQAQNPAPTSASVNQAQNPATNITVDAGAGRRAISPNIYGLSFGNTTTLSDLNVTLNRYGGNDSTRYNWKLNASNHAADWYFESIADKSAVPGERADTFIKEARAGGAQPLITIPMIPYIAKVNSNRERIPSFSVAKYGPQTAGDKDWPDAGGGVSKTTGKDIVGNDPLDAHVPNSPEFQKEWVRHLIGKWGKASAGGVKYYVMDNEYSLWFNTHRDVAPTGASMDEIYNSIVAYAGMVKSTDPSAQVAAPEEWGWPGYFSSGLDIQGGKGADKIAHGGMDYLPWLLQRLKAYDTAHHHRLLDVFTVHYYPQSDSSVKETPEQEQLRRSRSTRSLWDRDYVDESWIKKPIYLIPRLKDWVNTYYPGTKIGVTEYNWGAEETMNGATTQADVLGIFGREGVDVATRWTSLTPSTPTYKAFKMYRNYDGNKSTFGDVSVKDTVPNPDNVASFSAIRTRDGALTIMAISKYLNGATPVSIALRRFTGAGPVQRWRLTSTNTITHLPSISLSSGKAITDTLPAQSVTLYVIPK